ncbi:hypothetical protein Ahy_A10g048369 [Arachis hypogaea]|uniref:SWIM-type domain-containing protein n=1 Tax=Arachis hypogaea TaxID=3818 RepID=A0A445B4Y9_ARAHY|nr:hypothetical protein Ahy_A10g048369 [Arachis hypogaea]
MYILEGSVLLILRREFRIRMEYNSRKSVVVAISSYTISRGVDKLFMSPSHRHSMQNARCMVVYAIDLFEPSLYRKRIIGRYRDTTEGTCKIYNCESPIQVQQHHQLPIGLVVGRVHEMSSEKVLAIDLAQWVCDCGHFQVEQLPCFHVIACCAKCLDWQVYVNYMYKMSEIHKVYRMEFASLSDPETWPSYTGLTMVANPALRQI